MAGRRAVTATKMACDILHGTYSLQYLASHTIAGGNSNKTSLDQAIVQGVVGNYIRHSVLFYFYQPLTAGFCKRLAQVGRWSEA